MRSFFPVIILFLLSCSGYAQSPTSSFQFSAEVGGMVSSARQTPFWLRANQFGTVPLVAPAGIIRLGSSGVFRRDSSGKGWFAGYGVDVVGNAGPASRVLLPEAYAKIGYRSIELVVGRRKEVLGLVDTTLSSGSYSWSGNALPIPKIQIGTRGFAPLHFTNDLIAVNAFFAHGWFANTDSMKNSYLHQKAVYIRIGKPGSRLKLYGGVLHNVQWGGRSDYLGNGTSNNGQLPSSFNDYIHIVIAKQPAQIKDFSKHDVINQFGNHVGSIDVGAEMTLRRWEILAYYQHPFEDKSGIAMVNLPDGLYGLRLKRKLVDKTRFFQINQILVEYLTTMSQSGSTVNIGNRLYEGVDDYFNNFQYLNGWTQLGNVIGTPLLSPKKNLRPEATNSTIDREFYIVNNLVKAIYISFKGILLHKIPIEVRYLNSNNYGIFRKPFHEKLNQSSFYVSSFITINNRANMDIKASLALDNGMLLFNSVGGMLSIRKRW